MYLAARRSTLGVVLPARYLRGASPEVQDSAKPFVNSARDVLLFLKERTQLKSRTEGTA